MKIVFENRFDYIERVLDYLFITPVNNIYYWLPNCDEMNSTCGVNIDVLKKLVFDEVLKEKQNIT